MMEKTIKIVNWTIRKIKSDDSEEDEEAQYDKADDMVTLLVSQSI